MTESPNTKVNVLENQWMIRPCHVYDEEHSECTSFKGRFHQYFIHGENTDCKAWKTDYSNCKLWRDLQDETAFQHLVESEQKRRMDRLRPHYENTVWEKRQEPPKDWNKPLPEWMQKEHAKSYLGIKAAELGKGEVALPAQRTLCTIS